MINYTIEKTSIDEKETFIHIDNKEKTIELCTNDQKVHNRLIQKIGKPHMLFPPVVKINKPGNKVEYISGCSWKYNYFADRDNIRQILSMTNLLPRRKDEEEDIEKDNND